MAKKPYTDPDSASEPPVEPAREDEAGAALVKVLCEKYPELLVTTPHVEFANGEALVPVGAADTLINMFGDSHGIAVADG